MGGLIGSAVTRKTDYLVVGADTGSKLKKAQSLGTTILSNEEFMEKLAEAEGGGDAEAAAEPGDGQLGLGL